MKSEWRDLNPRHLGPKPSALPDCATLREYAIAEDFNNNFSNILHDNAGKYRKIQSMCTVVLYYPCVIFNGRVSNLFMCSPNNIEES